jgi:hypothetical protein
MRVIFGSGARSREMHLASCEIVRDASRALEAKLWNMGVWKAAYHSDIWAEFTWKVSVLDVNE